MASVLARAILAAIGRRGLHACLQKRHDWDDRRKERLGASYDEQADVLYLWRGEDSREVVMLNSDEGYLVRLDPESYEIVGFTIFDFCHRWQEDDDTPTKLTLTIPSLGFRGGKTSEPQTHDSFRRKG